MITDSGIGDGENGRGVKCVCSRSAMTEALEQRRKVYDEIMADVFNRMPHGPDRDWWSLRNEVERSVNVPVDVFRTWYYYETARLDANKRFLAQWGLAGTLENLDVLDLGCGLGAMLIACSQEGARVSGVDPNPDAVEWAGRRLQLHGLARTLVVGTAESIPFPAESVDIVFLMDVIEHVASHARALAEIHRVLRPNGTLVLTAPNKLSLQYLKRDPHYGLPLVCAMPPWMGRLVVVRITKRSDSYTVGNFPICTLLVNLLEKSGFIAVAGTHTWREGTSGWTRLKRTLRVNTLSGAFVTVAKRS